MKLAVLPAAMLLAVPCLVRAQCFPSPPATPPCCAVADTSFADANVLTWQDADPACTQNYDVTRGDLRTLWNTGTLSTFSTVCLPFEESAPGTTAADATDPPIEEGFWYLVRVDTATWNDSGRLLSTDRDPKLTGVCTP